MKSRIWQIAVVALTVMTLAATAGTLDAVKKRMAERQPALRSLLATGKAGEGRDGYLTARDGASGAERKTISEENGDRKQVYEEIATKTGAPVSQVGARRARAIAQQVAKGTWVQDGDGQWSQK